jgi:hypothetical protein
MLRNWVLQHHIAIELNPDGLAPRSAPAGRILAKRTETGNFRVPPPAKIRASQVRASVLLTLPRPQTVM